LRFLPIVFVCALVMLIAGCGKKTPEQTQPATPGMPGMARPIQPTAIDFDKVEELTPTGDLAKTFDKEFRAVFAEVFGGAKLFRFFEMGEQMGQGAGGSHFTYALKRKTKADDVDALKIELGTKGYDFMAEVPREEFKTLTFSKTIGGKTYAVTVGMTLSDQRVSVVVF